MHGDKPQRQWSRNQGGGRLLFAVFGEWSFRSSRGVKKKKRKKEKGGPKPKT